MIKKRSKLSKGTFFFLITAFLLFSFTGITLVKAQTYGRIIGKVYEAETNSPLPAANVLIVGTNRGAATDVNGRFVIPNVPPGTYKVKASFLGYQDATKEVQVLANKVVEVEFGLKETVLEGEQVVVYGALTRGQAKALHEQKNALNIKNVVSSEILSRFPDLNAAEAVQRIPSVSITYDQGEGEMIQVRGIPQQYNSVRLNGIRIPSPDPDVERAVGLDLVSADLMESIVVTKALTPDMDGDALGGTVDFNLKQTPDEPIYKFAIGGGYNQQESVWEEWGKGVQTFSGVVGKRFFNNKLGLMLTGSYYKTNRGSILQEYLYTDDVGLTIRRNKWTDYDVKRIRYGFTFSADYRLAQDHNLSLLVNSNTYLDDEIRRKTEYTIDDEEELRETRNRLEDQRLNFIKLDGEHRFGTIDVDWNMFGISTQEDMPDRTYWKFERDNPYSGLTNDQIKNLTGEDTFSGLSPLKLKKLRYDDNLNQDKDLGGAFNINIPFNFRGLQSTIKTGFKVRAKDRSYERHRYNAKPTDDITIEDGTYGFIGVKWNDDEVKDLPLGPFKEDLSKLNDNYDANEMVTAGYIMSALNWTQRFATLIGVRYEHTRNEYSHFTAPEKAVSSYGNILPSVHFTYKLDYVTNLRLALTTGISRPNYTALVPLNVIDEDDKEIRRGNPDLKPVQAKGVDLLFERFTPGLGLLSAGFFAKELTNALAQTEFTETYQGELYQVTKPINSDEKATIYGFEFAFNQRLSFLGVDFLNPFSIYTNYTYTHSESKFGDRKLPLSSNPKHVANFAIMYDNPKIGLSFAITNVYRSALIKSVGSNERTDIWYDAEYHLAISATQRITKNISVFIALNNLTNQPEQERFGDPTSDYWRPHQIETYGFWANGGLRFDF